jgi:AraC family transcriptional regulator
MMFLRIEFIEERLMAGQQMEMSLINNRTGELWSGFMSTRKYITDRIGNDLYSLQVYPPDYFAAFNPATNFTKWALTEVSTHDNLPEGILPFLLPAGKYAVFLHKGDTTNFGITLQYIFRQWLPSSGYMLDNRPHFEVLGDKYRNNDPLSEEEVWIPLI